MGLLEGRGGGGNGTIANWNIKNGVLDVFLCFGALLGVIAQISPPPTGKICEEDHINHLYMRVRYIGLIC